MTLLLTPGRRLLLLALCFLACYCLFSVGSAFVALGWGLGSPRVLRILTVVQDIIVFIVPALVTALVVTRQPAHLLAIDRRIPWIPVILAIAALIVSVPMMNAVIVRNAAMTLPEGLGGLEQWMREAEARGSAMIDTVMGGASVGDLVMALCIVGILAALSEELLFRGALQRLLSTGGMRPLWAVVVTALVFSAVHLQFYGFFPRFLLGLFLGCLLVWTRCLWVPIIAHFYNNAAYIVSRWTEIRAGHPAPVGTMADPDGNLLVTSVSALLTAICLYLIWRYCQKNKTAKKDTQEERHADGENIEH